MKNKTEHIRIKCAYTELIGLSQLIVNPRNRNKHPEAQIKRLSEIIDFQGQRAPIVVSNRSGFIVKGHARLEALKLLNWEVAAVDYQDYESEAQEYADMIADNEIARYAEFDSETFKMDLVELKLEDNFNYDMFGLMDFDFKSSTLKDIEKSSVEDTDDELLIVITCKDEDQQSLLFDEFKERRLQCKLIT